MPIRVTWRGWRRLALVLAVAWIPIGYVWGRSIGAYESHIIWDDLCTNKIQNSAELERCEQQLEKKAQSYIEDREFDKIVSGEVILFFGPLFLWFTLWCIWHIGRWVFAGFQSE
jgi:hypothetical protein